MEAIESVRSQTFSNFEIVVVDDGSTDSSPAKLARFNDPRLRIIRQTNAGVSIARTRAMREAQGTYVAFLDADDIWRPDHLFHLMQLSQRFKGAALYGNAFVEDLARSRETAVSNAVQYRIVEDYFLECAKGRAPFYTSSCMVLREYALELGGFPSGNISGEDLALWIKLAVVSSLAVSDYVGCIYRRNTSGLSARAYRNTMDISMAALNELLEEHEDWSEHRRQSISEYYCRLALAHCLDSLRGGELNQAKYFLRRAAGTRLLRRRLWAARLLALAPTELRNVFFRLADSRKTRI